MDRSSPATSEETRVRSDGVQAPAWRSLFAGTPREVLARLVQGDPLGVRDVVAKRLRASSLLLDADRVQLRAIAQLARSAARYRGRPAIAEWVDGHVLRILAEVVREDHESAGSASRTEPQGADAFSALAGPLGLDPRSMRRACAAFNVLPLADRGAFLDLVLANRSLDDLAREQGESATTIARRARRALDLILESASTAVERGGSP